MRVRLLTMGVVLVVAAFMSLSMASAATPAQTAKKSKSASAAKTGQTAAPSGTMMAAGQSKTAKPVHRRRRPRASGVPKGVAACIDRLIALAEKDPLLAYDKGPYAIINNGLLWDNPHSNCSVGNDPAMREKVFDLATAWQQKDAAKVRSSLQEIKSALPPAEKPMVHKTKKHRKVSAKKPPAKG